MNHTRKVTIIGSGPAGLTAAIYAARADSKPLLIEGSQPGGQLTTTTEIENFPGFPDGSDGTELMTNMRAQAERFGTEFKTGLVEKVDFSGEIKTLTLENGDVIKSQTVIIATGAAPILLGLESEQTFWGKGVSTCATCDGAFYRNLEVAVVGGGDSAIEEAIFLTKFAKQVTLIHRRDEFRASKIMQQRATDHSKIKILYSHALEEITGDTLMRGIRVRDLKTDEVYGLPMDGVFLAIGHRPNTQIFKDILPLDERGYISEMDGVKTMIPGIFAAGDVADQNYRQAITAAGSGCASALEAERYLER